MKRPRILWISLISYTYFTNHSKLRFCSPSFYKVVPPLENVVISKILVYWMVVLVNEKIGKPFDHILTCKPRYNCLLLKVDLNCIASQWASTTFFIPTNFSRFSLGNLDFCVWNACFRNKECVDKVWSNTSHRCIFLHFLPVSRAKMD